MRQNKYDDPVFFKKYGEMLRSKNGLAGAGEWHEFRALLPDFRGKAVLDLGCGYGWHCKYAQENGAAQVLGVDISAKMLEKAQSINAAPGIAYRRSAMEDLDFSPGSFQVVLSSLAFHYVADFPALVRNVSRWLVPGGCFVFSVEHPVFTAQGPQDWFYDSDGKPLHFPVDNYFLSGQREAIFLGEKVTKYHRTVTEYVDALLQNDFQLLRLVEPQPPAGMLDLPGMRDELRRPMMLLLAAQKRN